MTSGTKAASLRHRKDIQGLRAIAVGTVVAYHAGTPYLDGGFVGVDLFFVISGFLITSLLLAELTRNGRVSLAGFWARRARRILPASTLVLVATAAGVALVVPALERPEISKDLTWSALFSANWRFAQQSTDYLAEDRATSPVLHFWSLGVEEQFYLFWPLIVVAVVLLCRGRRTAVTLGTVTTLIVAASLWWCVVETGANQPYAYFGTPARAWQLGLGCLLAIGAPWVVRLGKRPATLLALLGAIGLAVSLVGLQEAGGSTPYPGWAALLPTVSAVLLLAAGIRPDGTPVGRVLSIRPLQHLGDLSYSWYLWHFPVLILGGVAFGTDRWWVTVALVGISYVAAEVSFRWVETPMRSLPLFTVTQVRSLALGAALVAVAATAAVAVPRLGEEPARTVEALSGKQITLRPAPEDASHDYVSMRAAGCDLDFEEVEMPECAFAAIGADRQVVLLGDSHAVVMFPPLEKAANQLGWQLNNWTKSGCSVADVTVWSPSRERAFTECDDFRDMILERVVTERPDAVVISFASRSSRRVVDRQSGEVLERLSTAEIPVILVVDPPIAPFAPPTCLAEEAAVAACTFDAPSSPSDEVVAAEGLEGVELISFTDQFCRRRTCSPVWRNVLVYRDTNHLTKTYALTLAPQFTDALDRIEGAR